MIRLEEKAVDKYLTWNEIGNSLQQIPSEDLLHYDFTESWRKWTNPLKESVMSFSINNIKRSELQEFTNIINQEQSCKDETTDEEEAIFDSWKWNCSEEVSEQEFSKKNDFQTDYVPKMFTVANIDPNYLVNVTSSFRGNITTYETYLEPEKDKFKVVGRAIEDEDDISEQEIDGGLIEKILDSDLVIFDVAKSQTKFIEVWYAIKTLRKMLEMKDPKLNPSKMKKIKTFILISSLMTWSNTRELFSDTEFILQEYYYGLRESHEAFKPMYLLENEFLKLGCQYSDWVRVMIVSTGLIYGPGETDLSALIELSSNNGAELPIFGTGQNHVPVIHIDDLIRFLNHLVHNFPDNYDCVFAVEPDVMTQSQIISVLHKNFTNAVQTRLVQSKNCLMYDITEEEVFKLSANLPVHPSYLKITEWKNNHRFKHSMPHLVRRYFSLHRSSKPPCVIVSGPQNNRVKIISNQLSELLGAVYLTPEIMKGIFLDYMGTKVSSQLDMMKLEKSINPYTSLPSGRDLIRVLHRVFLLPQIQKKGYVLEGFPETAKEAKLLKDTLKTISEHDARLFSNHNVNTSLLPDKHVVLLPTDLEMIKDIDSKIDENIGKSAETLLNLDNFRFKMSGTQFSSDFLEEEKILPLLFNIDEFQTDLECAQFIFDMIKPMKDAMKETPNKTLTVSSLLNLMMANEKKISETKTEPTDLLEEDEDKLKIELNTRWEGNECDISLDNENSDKNELDKKNQSLSLKFAYTGDKNVDELHYPDEYCYKTGIVIDKVNKFAKGTEGNASQCLMKKMKVKTIKTAQASASKTSTLNVGMKGKSLTKFKLSCKDKLKYLSIKDRLIPVMEWTSIAKKVLRGTITGWCLTRENTENDNKFSNDFANFQNPADCTNKSIDKNNAETILDTDSISNFSSDLIRTNPLFKNSDMKLYCDFCMFLSPNEKPNYRVRVFNHFNLAEEIILKECKMDDTKTTGTVLDNYNKKRDSRIVAHPEDKKFRSFIRRGELVQNLQRCCGMNEITYNKTNNSDSDNFKSLDDSESLIKISNAENKDDDKTDENSKNQFFNNSPNVVSDVDDDGRSFNVAKIPERRWSDMSILGRAVLKHSSGHSSTKKSLSISRKVRFSSADDTWSGKSFEDKFNSWLENHLEELEENICLKLHDPCFNADNTDLCSVYLFKILMQQVGSDWRNEHLHSLLDQFSNRMKLVNFEDIQSYFEKFWFHFRFNPPHLTLLPSSIMIQIEKNYVCSSVRWNQRKTVESVCDDQFKKTQPCVCNAEKYYEASTKEQDGLLIAKQLRDNLGTLSSFDIFDTDFTKSRTDVTTAFQEDGHKPNILYTDCKGNVSREPNDNFGEHSLSLTTITPFWHDSKCHK